MKKLTKMSLEKLAKTMSVIPEDEMNMYWGMYQGDCFWRCVAYILSGNPDFPPTEAEAEVYALEYTAEKYFNGDTAAAHEYLTSNNAGASMGNSEALSYVQGNSAIGDKIRSLKISEFSELGYVAQEGGPEWHAVIEEPSNDPDYKKYYDPQGDQFIYIRADKVIDEVNSLDIK